MLEKYAHVRAMQAIFSEPGKSFSVRSLAAKAGLSPAAAGIALSGLKKEEMVSLGVVGRSYQYRANLESPLCRQWKILFNLDELEESGILGELVKRMPNAQSVLLYGSFARGTNDEKSDVDILAIALRPAKMDLKFLDKMGREVNLSAMSLEQWKKKAASDRVFYENVIYDSIVLHGTRPVVA